MLACPATCRDSASAALAAPLARPATSRPHGDATTPLHNASAMTGQMNLSGQRQRGRLRQRRERERESTRANRRREGGELEEGEAALVLRMQWRVCDCGCGDERRKAEQRPLFLGHKTERERARRTPFTPPTPFTFYLPRPPQRLPRAGTRNPSRARGRAVGSSLAYCPMRDAWPGLAVAALRAVLTVRLKAQADNWNGYSGVDKTEAGVWGHRPRQRYCRARYRRFCCYSEK